MVAIFELMRMNRMGTGRKCKINQVNCILVHSFAYLILWMQGLKMNQFTKNRLEMPGFSDVR